MSDDPQPPTPARVTYNGIDLGEAVFDAPELILPSEADIRQQMRDVRAAFLANTGGEVTFQASFAPFLPPPADLTDDPLACALVEAVARKPWVAVHWHALRDRLEEIGKTAAWAALEARLELFRYRPQDWTTYKRLYNRTLMRRLLKGWRAWLATVLQWERVELPF